MWASGDFAERGRWGGRGRGDCGGKHVMERKNAKNLIAYRKTDSCFGIMDNTQ